MTAPNIVGVTTVTGKTVQFNLSDTLETSMLVNSANSGAVYKIESIIVANVDGASTADITVSLKNSASGGTNFKIASNIDVPPKSTIVVVDKASAFYMEENREISCQASAANDLSIILSYEEIM
jgi:hypothetical protein